MDHEMGRVPTETVMTGSELHHEMGRVPLLKSPFDGWRSTKIVSSNFNRQHRITH